MNRKRHFIGAMALAACAAWVTAASAAQELRLTYAQPNAEYWDLDVAIEKGFFAEEGFDPKQIALQSSVGSVQMLISESTHVAGGSPEPVVLAYERGATDAAVFLAPVTGAAWTFAATPEIKSFADLKGKRIGVSNTKGGESALIQILMEKHGLERSEYNFLRVGITPLKYAALRKNSISAAVLFQPTGLLAIEQGMTNLANFSEIETYPYPVYSVSREWANRNDNGARLARAIIKAQKFIQDPKNRAEAEAILAKYTRQDKDVVSATYDLFLNKAKVFNDDGRVDMEGMERLVDIMVDQKLLAKRPEGGASKYVLPLSEVGIE